MTRLSATHLIAVIAMATPLAHGQAAIPFGAGQQDADLGGVSLSVYTQKPNGCAISGLLLVFHGIARDAAAYRDHARPLASGLCRLVVAPLFDAARFPTWRYQRGGLADHGSLRPAADWTVNLVPALVAWARRQEQQPNLPYALIGHSAGAQFLSRVAAFAAVGDATRIVIANPSTWVRPSLTIAAPYGFAGVGGPEAALRGYLAAPVTILLGQDDTGDRNLANSAEAMDQGENRLARGQAVFHEAEQAARQRGLTFNWRLAVVPGVGHDARAMFASGQAVQALR
jgi:hypothetical protein